MFNNKIRKHVGIWLATFACAAAVSCYTSQDVQADHYSYGNNPTHQSTDAEIAQGLVRARPYKYVHSVPCKQMYVFHHLHCCIIKSRVMKISISAFSDYPSH